MKKEKWQQILHMVAGILVIVFGFHSFESRNFSSAAYYLTLAIIFLIVAGAHPWVIDKCRNADVAFNLLESVTLIYSGFLYKDRGDQILFYLITLAGCFFTASAIHNFFSRSHFKYKSPRRKKRNRHSSKPVRDQTNFYDNNKT